MENKNIEFDKNSKPQKFFDRFLDNDLSQVSEDLKAEYSRIASGEMRGITSISDSDLFSYSKSYSTQKSREYNVFQMYYPWSHELYSAVVDMVREACDYYDINYNSEQWYCQAWFNINSRDKDAKLNWHDHISPEHKIPAFHGYYSVNAEPSETLYNINGKIKINKNKNNRAVLSMVGFQHSQAPWTWDGDRITIAYDVVPLRLLELKKADGSRANITEQHFFPLPKNINKSY